jgi:hypothetical protein
MPDTTGDDPTDADPLVVALLVVALAGALGVALFVTGRLVARADGAPTG